VYVCVCVCVYVEQMVMSDVGKTAYQQWLGLRFQRLEGSLSRVSVGLREAARDGERKRQRWKDRERECVC
jgi:hypothetical protein